jgi:hypothetical protein
MKKQKAIVAVSTIGALNAKLATSGWGRQDRPFV